MRAGARVRPVQKVGPLALLGILVFALVFALLPGGSGAQAQTGVSLENVQLTLYPARDPDAVWQFRAAEVQSDPVSSTTELSRIADGQRLLRERGADGNFSGTETLDATIAAPRLTINGQDDMVTPRADITLVKECADLSLFGTPEQPVRIEQGAGFSAPHAKLDSPNLSGDIYDLRGIDRRRGCMVLVRPDQYVAHVLPLGARRELAAFLGGFMRPARS